MLAFGLSLLITRYLSILFGYPNPMPVEFEVSLVQVGNSLRVTIPKEVVRALGLKKGQKLGLVLTDSEIRLRAALRK